MHGDPSDLHIIIHERGQKLLILHLTPYKQLAEETKESQSKAGEGEREREREIFGRVQWEDRHSSSQTETPNAAKITC